MVVMRREAEVRNQTYGLVDLADGVISGGSGRYVPRGIECVLVPIVVIGKKSRLLMLL